MLDWVWVLIVCFCVLVVSCVFVFGLAFWSCLESCFATACVWMPLRPDLGLLQQALFRQLAGGGSSQQPPAEALAEPQTMLKALQNSAGTVGNPELQTTTAER